jgi:glycosyltransferase involved in cell wall biosynthesis
LEKASAIHVTSKLEQEELNRFGWRLPQVRVIPNGVDEIGDCSAGTLSADVAEIATGKPFILFLGRISWKKGLDRLIAAFALANLPKLVIVGPDDENMLPKLMQQARNSDVADRVRFLPRTVLGADKEHLFAQAQLFVLASYSENFGNTVLEAMQHGLPVIATPEVGAAKIVREASAGMVVSGEPEPLSRALRQLAETKSLARAMGDAGRRHVREHYCWPRVAAEMEGFYAKLTSGRGDEPIRA